MGGFNLPESIDAPVWHSAAFPSSYPRSWQPGELVIESRVGLSTMDELRDLGHSAFDAGPWSLGRLSAVATDPARGLLYSAADARGMQGYAVGR